MKWFPFLKVPPHFKTCLRRLTVEPVRPLDAANTPDYHSHVTRFLWPYKVFNSFIHSSVFFFFFFNRWTSLNKCRCFFPLERTTLYFGLTCVWSSPPFFLKWGCKMLWKMFTDHILSSCIFGFLNLHLVQRSCSWAFWLLSNLFFHCWKHKVDCTK